METGTAGVLTSARPTTASTTALPSQAKTWYAIRGATTVERDDRQEILSATRELLTRILEGNDLRAEDIVSAFFVVTRDLTAAYPAEAARQIGWTEAALLCASDMEVPGSLPRCVRVLLHVHGTRRSSQIRHAYLRGAAALRPDWAERGERHQR
jgi:chorismate mutase